MHSATKPTPVPMPKDENRMNAHTRAGIFRRKVANPRTNFASLGAGDTLSLANRDTKKARTAAAVVAEMAMATVTNTLLMILDSFAAPGSVGGKKSSLKKAQKFSEF